MTENGKTVRFAIVGGGIAGLSAAHALRTKHGLDECDVVVLEASGRVGGNLRTVQKQGFLLDEGPDSWVAMKPHATELITPRQPCGSLLLVWFFMLPSSMCRATWRAVGCSSDALM